MTVNQLMDIAERENVTVNSFMLEKREALSFRDSTDGSCHIAIDPRRVASMAEGKTKLAHEIGHCVTGAFYNIHSTFDIKQKHENTADKWAIKKLIPEDELKRAVADGCTEYYSLAELFGVTEELLRKAVSLYEYGNLHSV